MKWFDDGKGFGFIGQDDGGTDLFVHFKGLEATGLKKLIEGQKVSYKIEQGKKGAQAAHVEVVKE